MPTFRRPDLPPGLYDELVTARLAALLDQLPPQLTAHLEDVAASPAPISLLNSLLRDALDLALDALPKKPTDGHHPGLALAEAVLAALHDHAPDAFSAGELHLQPRRLRAISSQPPTQRPRGSLHTSSLLVNAEGDALLDHLRSEFDSADRVDLLCAFIKLSGFERLRSAIERHCGERGRPLRILTTTYMGASDHKALERLAALPNVELKVSFDDASTRLHAKAWVFHRESGYSTAYVGSSNLSHAAQLDGLEWNVRLTATDQPAVVEQMAETFAQYWADADAFEALDPADAAQATRLRRALSGDVTYATFLPELEPKDFQKPILAELMTARRLGRHRNLVVAATGTGKTVLAALDYRALRVDGAVDTLLFVAHRREILVQARDTFRAALQLRQFGELLVDGERPEIGRYVFASVDSLRASDAVDPAAFDHVILDEAHHSAAKSWQDVLDRVASKQLVGLTGTPERADGLDYEAAFPRPWVGNLRVWNAIPHALVPFRYYALDVDGVDLRDVTWRAGRYAPEALDDKLVTAADLFVRRAVAALTEHIARPDRLSAFAFCSSVRHAEAVDARLRAHGLRSAVLTGHTDGPARRRAKDDLTSGKLQVLCVVDLYNEGVDVPNVNTLLFFRPTESATVFLQQLGRGLRRSPGKAELVVFDLTGRQHLQFRFDRRLRAALGVTPRELTQLVQQGFGRLPVGCHLTFDPRAQADVLDQLKRAIPSDTRGIRALLAEPAHRDLSLAEFLRETDVELTDLYAKDHSWTLHRRAVLADAAALADGEAAALANVHKLLHVGDDLRLSAWDRLTRLERPTTEVERRLTWMLFGVLYGKHAADDASWPAWAAHHALRAELADLGPVLAARNALLTPPHRLEPDVPLALHARYLSAELSAAFDQRTPDGKLRDYYTGVERTGGGRYDLLLVTMEKAAATKEHLRYRDFPLADGTFHWQSKAATRADSAQGRRHLDPAACTPLLLVRPRADDRPGVTAAFTYLGPVTAQSHHGERPITVTWRLAHPMPGELLRAGRVAA